MSLHKQQSTDGQVLCSGVGRQLKTSTVLTSDAYTDENVNSVEDMIVTDRRLTVRHAAQ